jgi:hypothetical protein
MIIDFFTDLLKFFCQCFYLIGVNCLNFVRKVNDLVDVIKTITDSPIMQDLWQRYQKKYSYAADVTWEMAVEAVKGLAEKAIHHEN